MALPMTSGQFKQVVEPLLNKAFDGVYDQRKDEYQQVFTTPANPTPRKYHEEPVLAGFGNAPEMPAGTAVSYQSGGINFVAKYVYKIYGLAFALTKELEEDGEAIQMGKIFSEFLAQSLIETKETICANILNRAFNASYLGGDNVSLISNAHPLFTGGSYSNLLSTPAAMSQTSVEQMIIQIRKAVDDTGKKIRLQPKKLVISPDNIMQAKVLLKSALRTGSNVNDINPLSGELDDAPAVITRLTSPTAWYITTNAPRGLQMMVRRKLTRSMEGDFETESMRYKATERYVPGWTNPRIIFGTPGA